MYFALVYYPGIEQKEFHVLRQKYDHWVNLMEEHVPFVFPLPESIGFENLKSHISQILEDWKPFDVHFSGFLKSWDHFLMLGIQEGNDQAIKLHDELYSDILAPHLRKDLPFTPHVGLGLFSKEQYDIDNPTDQLSLDEEKYQRAKAEYETMGLDFWRTIDHLTLVKLNSDFSKCWDIFNFKIYN